MAQRHEEWRGESFRSGMQSPTDAGAAISPGALGGGLFDSQGRLVGVTAWEIREGKI